MKNNSSGSIDHLNSKHYSTFRAWIFTCGTSLIWSLIRLLGSPVTTFLHFLLALHINEMMFTGGKKKVLSCNYFLRCKKRFSWPAFRSLSRLLPCLQECYCFWEGNRKWLRNRELLKAKPHNYPLLLPQRIIKGATGNYQKYKTTSSRRFGTAARLPRSRCGRRLYHSSIWSISQNTTRLGVEQACSLVFGLQRFDIDSVCVGKKYLWLGFEHRVLSCNAKKFVLPFQYAAICANPQ